MELLPWIETIPLIRAASEHSIISARRRNLYYSSPQNSTIWLTGLQLIYSRPGPTLPEFRLQICAANVADTWSPFFFVPERAIAGYQNQGVLPIIPLPEPYQLRPYQRLQISLLVTAGSFTPSAQDALNLVGVRQQGEAQPCYS